MYFSFAKCSWVQVSEHFSFLNYKPTVYFKDFSTIAIKCFFSLQPLHLFMWQTLKSPQSHSTSTMSSLVKITFFFPSSNKVCKQIWVHRQVSWKSMLVAETQRWITGWKFDKYLHGNSRLQRASASAGVCATSDLYKRWCLRSESCIWWSSRAAVLIIYESFCCGGQLFWTGNGADRM